MTLLSYLAVYSETHWPNPFPLLFPPDCERSDLDAVNRLDLANSLGSWATTVKKLEKELIVNIDVHGGQPTAEPIPDSWDEELPQSIPSTYARFGNLRHLSLSVNLASSSAAPSWASLISLSSHFSRLASLSLAHWPVPTYTPNAAKGRVQIVDTAGSSAPQAFGGTDMYTAFDNNWREAAGILKSLSRNLYCLTWLDLTGCGAWLPALSWKDENGETGPDWNGSWRDLTTLVLAVGWLPGRLPTLEELEASSSSRSTASIDSTRAIEQLYGNSQAIQHSLAQLAERRLGNSSRPPRSPDASTVELPWNVEHEREKSYFRRDVAMYHTQQDTAKRVADEIRSVRRPVAGRYITFEFGEILDASYTIE